MPIYGHISFAHSSANFDEQFCTKSGDQYIQVEHKKHWIRSYLGNFSCLC